MLLILLIPILFQLNSVNCHVIPIVTATYSDELIKCVVDIVAKYFGTQKMLTYAGNKMEDVEFLKPIQALNTVTMVSKRFTKKLRSPHKGYFISTSNYTEFTEHFLHLTKEWTWNPEARFVIIVRLIEDYQLDEIFDKLLKLHMNNVIVVIGTIDADLYSYNPFDNYGCGKHYDKIINYGKCSQADTQNLFPDKYVTKLQNCTFVVSVPNWPPYTIVPKNDTVTHTSLSYGMEPYLLRLIGKMCGFTIKIYPDEGNNESFSTVSSDMKAFGSLKLLQNFKVDIVLGGLILIPSRAFAFNYLYEFLPYVDEIRFAVKEAELLAAWKNVYLEFDTTVWLLILLSIIVYSIIMIILLHAKDKSSVVFKLLDNLVLHGCKIDCQPIVKCIFIVWIWYAYLINAFYQSSLVSLTTNPASEKQISTEADIMQHKLKPCFSNIMHTFYEQTSEPDHNYTKIPDCHTTAQSINKVMTNNKYYTIVIYGVYKYNIQKYLDDNGNHYIYALTKPYSKVIYSMYFYKGFPLMNELRSSALRVREMGLVAKVNSDMSFLELTKHNLNASKHTPRFAMPWCVYILGSTVATITLLLEILSTYTNP